MPRTQQSARKIVAFEIDKLKTPRQTLKPKSIYEETIDEEQIGYSQPQIEVFSDN